MPNVCSDNFQEGDGNRDEMVDRGDVRDIVEVRSGFRCIWIDLYNGRRCPVDHHANVEFRPLRGQREMSLEEFVLRCSVHFAVIEPREQTRIGDLNIEAQNPTTPIKDINIVISSWEKRINLGRLAIGQHEEWEKVFDELQHCGHRTRQQLEA